jgi:hypothetical protein
MRARKPCVLARLRLFGWNVLFTIPTPFRRYGVARGAPPVRRGAKLCDCIRARSGVSTRASTGGAAVQRRSGTSIGAVRTPQVAHSEALFIPRTCLSTVPEAGPKKVQKLWILWKTQDSRRRGLWITRSCRLLALEPSDRIGHAPKSHGAGYFDLENALSDGRAPAIHRHAPAAPMEFSTATPSVGGIVVPYPQRKGTGKGHGHALHPLPSVSASPSNRPPAMISTDVERRVDKFGKPQVGACRSFPRVRTSNRWLRSRAGR